MKDLIYNQHKIPAEQWPYGFRTSAATGCGWIATYNALRLMGYSAKPEELIAYYERQLPLIHGNAGTSVWGPLVRLRQWGFPVKVTLDRKHFDETARDADACILFFRWRRGWKIGAHFVALHHDGQGFVGYNTFRNSTGPDRYGESLDGFLRQRKYFGCVLLSVCKRH